MGAIATIVVLIVFLLIGLVEIAAGIAGLVISVKKARSGIAVARVFTAISAVVLAIGILFAVIPSGFSPLSLSQTQHCPTILQKRI